MIPYLEKNGVCSTLMVDGKPYFIRGGETHNSGSSSAPHMDSEIWPFVRKLGLNTLLVPVSWERFEPAPGQWDFTDVDALLQGARQEGLRLILLWFGLWKNAQSTYAPTWIKQDDNTYFRSRLVGRAGTLRSDCSISPCCEAAVERCALAFAALMNHLKKADPQHTVIAVQVENEVGLLGSERDFCAAANTLYHGAIPDTVAAGFEKSGTWEQAFGVDACAWFMSWCYAGAIQRIAAAGKRAHPLPLYVNAWTVQYENERPGSYPAGAPVAEYMEMWQLVAPDIEWYSPDIYLPDFAAECLKYTRLGNPLFVPEAHKTNSAATHVLYLAGRHWGIGFSPFAIEDMANPGVDVVSSGFMQEALGSDPGEDNTLAPSYLKASYDIIRALWETIVPLRGTAALSGFLCYHFKKEELRFSQYDFRIRYLDHTLCSPRGGGLIAQVEPDTFYIAAVNCVIDVLPKWGESMNVEYLCLEELLVDEDELAPGRTLNGDEQCLVFTRTPKLLHARFHKVAF